MPAPAKPIDDLPARQRRLLGEVAQISEAISEHEVAIRRLVSDRHALFVRAHTAGVAISTIAAEANVSGPAVSKAIRSARGDD